MTPEQAEHLRELFFDARETTRRAEALGTKEAYAADAAVVEAFNMALRKYIS